MTFTKRGSAASQSRSTRAATGEPVRSVVLLDQRAQLLGVRLVDRRRSRRAPCCSARRRRRPRRARRRRRRSCRPRSCGPVGPSTTTRPPVMYSQPWSPTPSTTALRARVADREALAGEPAEERAAARGAVEHRVADDHVLLGDERRRRRAGGRRARRPTGPCRCSRWRRRCSVSSTPGASHAAEALAGRAAQRDAIVSAGRPVGAVDARSISLERMPPTQRLLLRTRELAASTRSRCSIASLARLDRAASRARRRAPVLRRARAAAACPPGPRAS